MTQEGRWLPDVEGYAVRLQDGLVAFYPLAKDAPHYMRHDVDPTVLELKVLESVVEEARHPSAPTTDTRPIEWTPWTMDSLT